MKQNIITSFFFIVAFCVIQYSCHKEGKNIEAISTHGTSNSHNNGTDCITCHKKDGQGSGNGWFVVAGSVFQPDQISFNSNVTIHLYNAANGTGGEVATIKSDALGNFYTTQSINFGNGLYPAIESNTGSIKYMGQVTRVGACNGCHNGGTTDRLFCN